MPVFDRQIEHLLRRAGFGARPDEIETYRGLSLTGAVSRLLDYERIPDDVDSWIGQPGYVWHGTRAAQHSRHTSTSSMPGSAGCSGWCTATGRSRRR